MGKKTITGTKNVYELAQERLKVIFMYLSREERIVGFC